MTAWAWSGDWRARIRERLREKGFASVAAFVDARPKASLLGLATELGQATESGLKDVAAVQLERMLLDEAKASGTLERRARDLLARRLHAELPEGWRREWIDTPGDVTTPFFRLGRALSPWCAGLGTYLPECSDAADRVFLAMSHAAFPEGWLPSGPDDPLLVDVFRAHWTVSDGSGNGRLETP
jgi:hypothetical protein